MSLQQLGISFDHLVGLRLQTEGGIESPLSVFLSRCFLIEGNSLQRPIFDVGLVWPEKQPKIIKNEENCRNQNRLMKFSEIWF